MSSGDEPSKRTIEQLQFNFIINKKQFVNQFDTDEADYVKVKFQESMQRVFNGMSALKSIEFTGFWFIAWNSGHEIPKMNQAKVSVTLKSTRHPDLAARRALFAVRRMTKSHVL